jgi:hypothetical protein
MTVDDIMREIDRATEPAVMSKEEAYDFLAEVAEQIISRKEALKDEISELTRDSELPTAEDVRGILGA